MAYMFILLYVVSFAMAAPAGWESTIERVVPSVVMIRSYTPQSFDGKNAGSSYATGFIVDAERGLLLTNRHVVQPGPVVAEAILQNNEEIQLHAVYRDPVHDFGFFKYDPEDIQFMEVRELTLRPSSARAGAEIRLIGSDSGEKISILSGILARLDREAPHYGQGYNDYNTFYFQAASSSSGGSSGSPVIDQKGHVVALNAGSKRRGASSFFLPLDRVVRALGLIQEGLPVTRGTLHTTFLHKTFDEVGRLGLQPETEALVRRSDDKATGMLVVEKLVMGGQADGILEPGDVLIRINKELASDFISLESTLDEGVGGVVRLRVERGGETMDVDIKIADLHEGVPAAYIEVGGAVLHNYSHQMARSRQVPIAGVYVAKSGYMLDGRVRAGDVIVEVDGQKISNLDDIDEALKGISEAQDFNIRAFHPSHPHSIGEASVSMDRRWFPARRCTRDDTTGLWPCKDLSSPTTKKPREAISTKPLPASTKMAGKYADAFVGIDFHIPFRTDGVYGTRFMGVGVVVDAERGLVLVDRDTVPVGLGDMLVNFGMSVDVPGTVVALHAGHNLALIEYDPALLGDTPVSAVTFDGEELTPGDKVHMVGPSLHQRIESEETRVSAVRGLDLPLSRAPFFRETNLDLVNIRDLRTGFIGGVLTDKRGKASALWASFPNTSDSDQSGWWRGIPGEVINRFLEDQNGWRSTGAEWTPVAMTAARKRGLPADEAKKIEAHDSERRQVLQVRRVTTGGPSDGKLKTGDILLSMNGQPITRLGEIEVRSQNEKVEFRILRGGKVKTIELTTERTGDDRRDRVILWAGVLLQEPYPALAQQRGQPMTGVYVAWAWRGSPAGRYKLGAGRRIVAIDGMPTPDLDAFVEAVLRKEHGSSVRIQTVDLQGRKRTLTLKTDEHYWPVEELVRTQSGWVRRIPQSKADAAKQ
jgi:S1-C subfamily serine protease